MPTYEVGNMPNSTAGRNGPFLANWAHDLELHPAKLSARAAGNVILEMRAVTQPPS
jgi:hypothetical protein